MTSRECVECGICSQIPTGRICVCVLAFLPTFPFLDCSLPTPEGKNLILLHWSSWIFCINHLIFILELPSCTSNHFRGMGPTRLTDKPDLCLFHRWNKHLLGRSNSCFWDFQISRKTKTHKKESCNYSILKCQRKEGCGVNDEVESISTRR